MLKIFGAIFNLNLKSLSGEADTGNSIEVLTHGLHPALLSQLVTPFHVSEDAATG